MKWILIGCGGLIIIGGLIFAAVTFFAIHKARQAGLDPDLIKRNPALAAAKMLASANPDIEIVGVNEGRGTITLREKSSGKTVTLNLSDVEKGHISFEGAQGEKVEIRGEGQGGSVQVQTPEGTATFGAGGKLPAWLPAYPGAEQTGVFGAQGKQGESGTVQLKTSDSVDQVASFYEAELRKAGLAPRKNVITQDGRSTLATVTATDAASKRTANITASATDEGTVVGVTFEVKK